MRWKIQWQSGHLCLHILELLLGSLSFQRYDVNFVWQMDILHTVYARTCSVVLSWSCW